ILFDPSSSIIGSATFTLYDVPPDPSSTIAIGGPSVTTATTVPGQNARLTFSGTAGQRISLQISAALSACCADVYIIKPDATTLICTTVSTTRFIDTHTSYTTLFHSILFDPSSSIIGSATFTLFDPSITITGRVLDDSANGRSAVTVSL